MTAVVKLPRTLADAVNIDQAHEIEGSTVEEAFGLLFERLPGLRNHVLDETGAIRPHVAVFVDGLQADLGSALEESSEIRVIHAVSGGRR